MSDSDSFIHEVTEEVRRDRMFRLWKKYGPWVIALIVLVIAGTAAWNWWLQQQRQAARELGGAFLNTDIASVEDQQRLLGRGEGPAEVIARLRLAAALVQSGERDKAATMYWEIAAMAELPRAYVGLARLLAVRYSLPTLEPEEAIKELELVTAEGAPYRLLALELRAVIKLNSGDIKGAHADVRTILESPEATRELAERAAALMIASGGELPQREDSRGGS